MTGVNPCIFTLGKRTREFGSVIAGKSDRRNPNNKEHSESSAKSHHQNNMVTTKITWLQSPRVQGRTGTTGPSWSLEK